MIHKREVTYSVLIILIVAILATGLVYISLKAVDPAKYLDKNRDETRISDIKRIKTAIDLYIADGKDLNTLEADKTYISKNNETMVDGQGWLPLNFASISSGAPLNSLPVDPLNQKNFVYRVGVNIAQKTYEIDCRFENKNNFQKAVSDGGNNSDWYEIGTDLTIIN